jgi:N-acetylglutamate synthase-like GNAT family acetyltransferase
VRPARGPVRFRRPVEDDHPTLVEVVDEWWGGRRMRSLLPRLWVRDFASSGWIAEDETRVVGFLVGYRSPDRPVAIIHLLAVDPNRRREGIGAELLGRFLDDARGAGLGRVEALIRPDERPAVEFARALGFMPESLPPAHRIYGVPAFDDWDGPGEDRALLVRFLA